MGAPTVRVKPLPVGGPSFIEFRARIYLERHEWIYQITNGFFEVIG